MGKNLPLSVRRRNNRGLNTRVQPAWRSRTFNGLGNRAQLNTALAPANSNLHYHAKVAGTGGNAITIAYVNPGTANAPLSVSVVGNAITVNLATNGASAITTTAQDIAFAIRKFNTPANTLVHVNNYNVPFGGGTGGNDGTGVVTAMAATNLSGAV